MSGNKSSPNRRRFLQLAGISVAGIGAGSQLQTVGAQSSTASITIDDQETEGNTVVVAAAETDIEARLIIISHQQVDGVNVNYRTLELEAGTSFSDRTIELDQEITQSQQIRAEIRSVDGSDELYARDRATIAVGESLNDITPTIEFIDADPDAGFNYPYYLYISERSESDDELPLLVEPNNTGTGSDDFETHQERAEETIGRLSNGLAAELNVPTLVPVFPRPREEPVDWRHYTHQLDDYTLTISGGDLERIDLQLLQMVADARDRLAERGHPVTDDGILMNGFSASGNFVDRFTVLHPDEVLSVTAGGVNGMPLLPLEEVDGQELPFHVGIANVADLIGNMPDLDALNETRQFIYMGGDDENDTIPFDDAWTDDELRQLALDVYGDDMIEDRFARSEELYDEAGIDATFQVYQDVGHTPEPAFNDIVEFHSQTVEQYRSSVDDSPSDSDDDTTPSGDSESDQTEPIVDELPGFGIIHVIGALGGAGYLLKRRIFDTDQSTSQP